MLLWYSSAALAAQVRAWVPQRLLVVGIGATSVRTTQDAFNASKMSGMPLQPTSRENAECIQFFSRLVKKTNKSEKGSCACKLDGIVWWFTSNVFANTRESAEVSRMKSGIVSV